MNSQILLWALISALAYIKSEFAMSLQYLATT